MGLPMMLADNGCPERFANAGRFLTVKSKYYHKMIWK